MCVSVGRALIGVGPQVQEWIANLSTVSDMVEQWIGVQNLWIYMEAVFSSGLNPHPCARKPYTLNPES